ncbi:hypothetical protein ACFX2H_003862 [Malus domestica]
MPYISLKMQSPYKLLIGKPPTFTHLKVFGCACYPLLKPYNSSKLQPKTTTCTFLGYVDNYKGFLYLDGITNKVYISRHVLFDETQFPYSTTPFAVPQLIQPTSESSLPLSVPSIPSVSLHNQVTLPISHLHSSLSRVSESMCLISSSATDSLTTSTASEFLETQSSSVSESIQTPLLHHSTTRLLSSPTESSHHEFTQFPIHDDPDFQQDQLIVDLPIHMNLHPMQTRSKSGIVKRKVYSASVAINSPQLEPKTLKVTAKIP